MDTSHQYWADLLRTLVIVVPSNACIFLFHELVERRLWGKLHGVMRKSG